MFNPASKPVRAAAIAVAAAVVGSMASAGAVGDWLALCGKCANPTIFAASGIGSANAVAEARITRAEVEGWCANWQPDVKGCVQLELASQDLKKVYRATADCSAGRIKPIDGNNYTLAGVWDSSDIGVGRSKWRDAAGKVAGRDNASGGLAISQQWEVLCPAAAKGAKAAPPSTAAGAKAAANAAQPNQALPMPAFTPGQAVLAKYGSEWIPGRVDSVRSSTGAKGPEIAYEVSLANGKRGIVPAQMLRAR